MLHFTVGPAQLYTGVKEFLCEQIQNDLGSLSHRSQKFSKISEDTLSSFRQFFSVPEGYHIFYTSSATEGLQLISESLCENHHQAVQINNGSFGKLWCDLSASVGKNVVEHKGEHGQKAPLTTLPISHNTDLITITANETSSGVMYTNEEIVEVQKKYPEKILAIDVTSIMGAYYYDVSIADAWCFSVQKAFGLPAGLGILILSDRALQKALIQKPYRFTQLVSKMKTFQTPSTCNVLNIAAFGFVCRQFISDFGTIKNLSDFTQKKSNFFYSALNNISFLSPVGNSVSTLCFQVNDKISSEVIASVKLENMLIGSGYGKYKESEIRIANFPVHNLEDIKNLVDVLQTA